MKMLYLDAVLKRNPDRPPVWFMRQAGRYHQHYQMMKRRYSFIELCKIPEAAAETTFGPIQDFNFDAAILFSDLLFPLEVLGMGLRYEPGPKLDWHLENQSDLKKLNPKNLSIGDLVSGINFQANALQLIRRDLDPTKALLGFVGGPMTLFYYAAAGSHQGPLTGAREGITDGRFQGFCKWIVPLLIENMSLQAKNGADAVAMLDTCAGEIEPWLYRNEVVPMIQAVLDGFKQRHPKTPILYYSKGTSEEHWQHLTHLPIDAKGIDWNHDIGTVLKDWGQKWSIQGNFDPNLMFLPEFAFERALDQFFNSALRAPTESRLGWVCGLGHGVLQKTPEKNVRRFLQKQREVFKK